MTSFSDFIGLLVIQIYPFQIPKNIKKKQSIFRTKTSDFSSDASEQSGEEAPQEHDPVLPRESSHVRLPAASPSVSAPPHVYEKSVIWKPDFWLVAFITSMRTLSCRIFRLIQ